MNRLLIGARDKTNFFLQLMRDDLADGYLLVDPIGELAELAVNTIPKSHIHRTFYFEPADTRHPAAFNIFNGQTTSSAPTIAAQFCEFFDAIFPAGANTLTRNNARLILMLALRTVIEF